jgi:uncharacterized protein (TIGR02145 family)
MKKIFLLAIILLAFLVYMGCKKDDETFSCGDTFIDSRDGQNYNTVLIGDQCWMAENLNIGTMINGTNDMTDDGVIEKYCYDNDSANCNEYGGLYQWNEMMEYDTTAGVQGICPSGCHLPTMGEWTTLTDFLGGKDIAGEKMKEVGTTHWQSPNKYASNKSGFTAPSGGYRDFNGGFYHLPFYIFYWSSSERDTSNAWCRGLGYDHAGVSRPDNGKNRGFSVRCLKD